MVENGVEPMFLVMFGSTLFFDPFFPVRFDPLFFCVRQSICSGFKSSGAHQ